MANANEISWLPARSKFGQEIKIKQILGTRGVECFIPTEVKKNYRGKGVEHAVIPCMVFLRASKEDACALKTVYQIPINFLFDHATHRMMVVPDKQMEDFQRVFEVSMDEGGLLDQPLEIGDKVKVVQGALKGVEGNVLEIQGQYYVVVSICGSIFARAKVPRAFLEFDK